MPENRLQRVAARRALPLALGALPALVALLAPLALATASAAQTPALGAPSARPAPTASAATPAALRTPSAADAAQPGLPADAGEAGGAVVASESDLFQPLDVFQLEWAADPEISPDGRKVVFVRSGYDIMHDRTRGSLWLMNADGSDLRALTSGERSAGSPRWSPDGSRLIYTSSGEGGAQIWLRWMDTGQETELTHMTGAGPRGITWSPDGKWIAFSSFVAEKEPSIVHMPAMPKGANWGPAWKYIDKPHYRQDEVGYLPDGFNHVFVLPVEGGTPRQVTFGEHNDGTPSWSADSKALLFSADRTTAWRYAGSNTEVYEVSLAGGEPRALTDRDGPDADPVMSPDGKQIAWIGYDDSIQGYQVRHLYVMNADGGAKREVNAGFDRSVSHPVWSRDGRGLYVQYDDHGDTKIGFVDLKSDDVRKLADHVGGLDIGRPYSGGSYSVSPAGIYAFTHGLPDHPADVAVGRAGQAATRLTELNSDLFGHKTLAQVEEFTVKSSYDGKEIQGWIMKPPHFDGSKKYPLILEIHGGPYANYGDRFSAEDQLYAADGNVVIYLNPRGSTSYGEAFGNIIHLDYPDHDYDDLMSGVDYVVKQGYVDPTHLYVTGGSGGGVLTAWIVGHTDRFRAAVVEKPVINWYSFVLTADGALHFGKYWMPGLPWEPGNLEKYMARSPITYVGNVKTPTMVMTGEEDYRTPNEQAEQFYEALQLRKIPSAMVRIPDAGHDIARKPSNLVEKALYALAWFHKYGGESATATQ